MLRHPRHYSICEVIALGLAAGCFFVLSSCDSSTAPSRSGAANVTGSPYLTDDAPEDGIVVVGTGDPSVDVPAVQAAVDQGGEVVLKGHFSFDAPATKPLAPVLASAGGGYAPDAEILIARSVSISGARDDQIGRAHV